MWGEIPSVPEADSGIEELIRPRAIEPEATPLFQPSTRHYPPSNEPIPERFCQMDPRVMHTIALLDHAQKTRQAIQTVQQLQAEGKFSEDSFPVLPPIPEYTGPPLRHTAKPPLMYMEPDLESDFARGIGEPIPRIDDAACRILLRKSVATILLHLSFEGSKASVLDTLTDVAYEFLEQLLTRLRAAADNAGIHDLNGFPDIVEKVFMEQGIGSVRDLHEFYTTRVLSYGHQAMDTCRQLVAELEKLKQPVAVSQSASTVATVTVKDTFNVIRIKEEPSADIQLPSLDENSEMGEAEQFLHIEGLGNIEITVEEGITTDVDPRWPQSIKMEQDKTKSVESSDEPVNVTDTSGSVGGQDSVPQTPRSPRDATGDSGDPGPGPSSVSSPPPRSPPPSAGGSKPKKRKTSC